MSFSFWITASFFLCSKCSLSVLISHPWDMLLLLRFSDLPVFEKLLMWELFSSSSNSFHAKTTGFITTSTHLSLWTSFDDSNLACFSRFSLKQVISRAAVGWLCCLQWTLAPSCVIWVRVKHREAHSAAWTTNKDRVEQRWFTLKRMEPN